MFAGTNSSGTVGRPVASVENVMKRDRRSWWLAYATSLTPPAAKAGATAAAPVRAPAASGPAITIAIGTSMADAERQLILATLEHFNQQKERTAAALGVSLKTLYNRLKEYAADKVDAASD